MKGYEHIISIAAGLGTVALAAVAYLNYAQKNKHGATGPSGQVGPAGQVGGSSGVELRTPEQLAYTASLPAGLFL